MKKIIIASLLIAGSLIASSSGKRGVAPVTDEFYKTECASCHFAY